MAFFICTLLSPSKLSVCLQFRQMSAFSAINPLLCAHPFRSKPTVLLLALSEHAALRAKVVSVNLAADWGDNSVLSQQHMLKVASCQICWLYSHQRKLFQESYCVAMCRRTCSQPPFPLFMAVLTLGEKDCCPVRRIAVEHEWRGGWTSGHGHHASVVPRGQLYLVLGLRRAECF